MESEKYLAFKENRPKTPSMKEQFANVPMQWVGPVKISGPEIDVETELPLAT